jgi:hypothetical protein
VVIKREELLPNKNNAQCGKTRNASNESAVLRVKFDIKEIENIPFISKIIMKI